MAKENYQKNKTDLSELFSKSSKRKKIHISVIPNFSCAVYYNLFVNVFQFGAMMFLVKIFVFSGSLLRSFTYHIPAG
jgi:hypothetical protein